MQIAYVLYVCTCIMYYVCMYTTYTYVLCIFAYTLYTYVRDRYPMIFLFDCGRDWCSTVNIPVESLNENVYLLGQSKQVDKVLCGCLDLSRDSTIIVGDNLAPFPDISPFHKYGQYPQKKRTLQWQKESRCKEALIMLTWKYQSTSIAIDHVKYTI